MKKVYRFFWESQMKRKTLSHEFSFSNAKVNFFSFILKCWVILFAFILILSFFLQRKQANLG